MRTLNLISLYYYVCQLYDDQLHIHCFRHTKNGVEPDFTDQELISLYLFVQHTYRPRTIKDLYKIACDGYLDWFPNLPGYERFLRRLNRINSALSLITSDLCQKWLLKRWKNEELCDEEWLLTDSFPVVTCAGNRDGAVAPELTALGYNSTKRMHFWGVKVHVVACKVRGGLPVPVKLWIGPASEHDYSAQVTDLENLAHLHLSGDKAFESKELIQQFDRHRGEWMVGKKDNYGKDENLRQRNKAADKLYNWAVSKLKQPIEALFSCFAHFGIQLASVVRSTAGLNRHLMGHLAAALIGHVLFD